MYLFQNGEAALHFACREGLLTIVQTLCAFGCNVDVTSKVKNLSITWDKKKTKKKYWWRNKKWFDLPFNINIYVFQVGLTPLHLASRAGHTEIVRCLMLSGANAEIPNKVRNINVILLTLWSERHIFTSLFIVSFYIYRKV